MNDLEKYIECRKQEDSEFAAEYETGYQHFKIGVMLRQAREQAGVTQREVAQKLQTQKSAISRIENHAEDIHLSTLERYARALGKKLRVELE